MDIYSFLFSFRINTVLKIYYYYNSPYPLALASDPHIRFLVFGYILTIPLCIHAFLGTPLTRRIRSFVYTTRSMTIAQGVEEVGYVGFALVYT